MRAITQSIDYHLRHLRRLCPAPRDPGHEGRCLRHSESFIEGGQLYAVVLALLAEVAKDVERTRTLRQMIEGLGYGPEVREILTDLVAIDQGLSGLEWDDTPAAYLDYIETNHGPGYLEKVEDMRNLALLVPKGDE